MRISAAWIRLPAGLSSLIPSLKTRHFPNLLKNATKALTLASALKLCRAKSVSKIWKNGLSKKGSRSWKAAGKKCWRIFSIRIFFDNESDTLGQNRGFLRQREKDFQEEAGAIHQKAVHNVFRDAFVRIINQTSISYSRNDPIVTTDCKFCF